MNDQTKGRRPTAEELERLISDTSEHTDEVSSNTTSSQALNDYHEAASGVLQALSAAGFDVSVVSDLRRQGLDYQAAVPLLIEWIPRISYVSLLSDIVTTLAVPFARKQAIPLFLELFRNPPTLTDRGFPVNAPQSVELFRNALANGLVSLATPSYADDLIDLVLDRRLGESRAVVILGLPKIKDERLPQVLLTLLGEPVVAAFAIKTLRKIKYVGARRRIEGMLDDANPNVRREAKAALKYFDKIQA